MLLYLIYVISMLLVIADTRQAFPPVTILADINIDYITNFDFTRQTFDMIVDVDRQLKDNRFAPNFNNYTVKEIFHEIRFDDVESQYIGNVEYIFKGSNVTGIRTRERLTVPCHFSQNFPFDRHTCRIKLISRKLPSDLLLLTWRSPPHMSTTSTSTPYFLVDEIKPNTCDYKKSMPAASSLSSTFVTHACLAIRFVFTRSLCLVFYRFYMPSSLALFLSWLSFYVSRTDLVSRLLLVSFSLSFQLVICTLFLYSVAFPVAVATPADVWCALLVIQSILVVLFIFTSIVMESQVRKYRDLITDSKSIREDSRSRHERRAMRTAMYRKENNCTEKSACSYATVVEATYRRKGDQISLCSVRLDLVARLVCPIVYIILTSLYFLLYILSP